MGLRRGPKREAAPQPSSNSISAWPQLPADMDLAATRLPKGEHDSLIAIKRLLTKKKQMRKRGFCCFWFSFKFQVEKKDDC